MMHDLFTPLVGAADSDDLVMEIVETVVVRNRRGLHARAAAKFVKLAAQYDAEIEVQRNETIVCGLSIMGLMMLAAGPGCAITIRAYGNQAETAIGVLVALVRRKFDEED
ncbi:phosphocarrier protein HPr [uncultured Gammaproteobacteria bacterium]